LPNSVFLSHSVRACDKILIWKIFSSCISIFICKIIYLYIKNVLKYFREDGGGTQASAEE